MRGGVSLEHAVPSRHHDHHTYIHCPSRMKRFTVHRGKLHDGLKRAKLQTLAEIATEVHRAAYEHAHAT